MSAATSINTYLITLINDLVIQHRSIPARHDGLLAPDIPLDELAVEVVCVRLGLM